MHTFQEITRKFESFLEQETIFPNTPGNLYDPCRYMLEAGGKRIRPALCLMATELFGALTPSAFYTAAAFELFHNFTLIHDDIMDHAPLRRGRKTVHEQYGTATGILSGDVMSIYAYQALTHADTACLPQILRLFNQTAIEVCEGQQLDMDYEALNEISVTEYLRMIRLKTSVLLAACLQSGAILSDAAMQEQQLMYELGINLGLAFQLQDDYLDTFGENEQTGKQQGGDILAGKKTILWVQALQSADSASKAALLQTTRLSGQEKIAQTIALYESLQIASTTRQMIREFTEKALTCLAELKQEESRKIPLKELTALLLERTY